MQSDGGAGTRQVVTLPSLGAIVRHGLPNVVEASVVPFVLFYGALRVAGVWTALVVALAWSLAAMGRRLAGGRVPGVLVLGTLGTAVRTLVAFMSGSVFVYFLQPTLGTVVVALVFIGSVTTGRPMVLRLVQDFVPLPDGFTEDRRVRTLFGRLTLAWGGVHLTNAGVTLWLLTTQPIEVYVLARTLVALALTLAAVVASTVWFLAAARARGIEVRFRAPAPARVTAEVAAPAAVPALAAA